MAHDQKLCLAWIHLGKCETGNAMIFFLSEYFRRLILRRLFKRIPTGVDLILLAALETSDGLQCQIGSHSLKPTACIELGLGLRVMFVQPPKSFECEVFCFSRVGDHACEQAVDGSPIFVEQALEGGDQAFIR